MTDTSSRLQTIGTELMIGFIFSIISTAVFGIWFLVLIFSALGALIAGTHVPAAMQPLVAPMGAAIFLGVLIPLIFTCAFAVPSLLVTLRLNRMRGAVSQRNIGQLRELNSMAWAIIALILAGIVPGVLMLIAYSEINNLSGSTTVASSASSFSADSMDKLMRLKQLVDNGTITQQDFETQKQRLLGGTDSQSEPMESEELRKLKNLLDCGAITAEEYELHKRRFLEAL